MIPVFFTHSRRMLTRLVKFLINYYQIKNLSSISMYTKNQLEFCLIIKSNHLKVDFIGLKYYFTLKKKRKKKEKKKEASVNSNLATAMNFLASLLIKLNLGLAVEPWRLFLLVLGCKNKEAQFISFGTRPIRDVSPSTCLIHSFFIYFVALRP